QLDSREHLMRGGKSGAAVVPGDAEQSLLIQAVRYSGARKMPPTGKLKDDEIQALESWVKAGAIWPETAKITAPKTPDYVITPEQRNWWAFRPIADPPAPAVRDKTWPKADIDKFILAKLESRGLKPAPAADRRTLIRRATFDLIGLPPTPEEVDTFVRDRSPDAFAKVVERLLASPRYGERWGRFWLDIARYSDDKLNSTKEEPYLNAFRYRDWVIQAFNDDMPYDRFVKAQIAGDLMPDAPKYQPGLGFYALSPEFQDDRVDATTRGFLALTVACAQCHDHKYDPIPTKDYYSLLGIFNNTKVDEIPLAPKPVVEAFQGRKQRIESKEKAIQEFIDAQSLQLSEILGAQISSYMMASVAGSDDKLDSETLKRWIEYLKKPEKDHSFLNAWYEARKRDAGTEELTKIAAAFQSTVFAIHAEKKLIDDKNHISLGINPDRQALSGASLLSIERNKYVLWEELFGPKGVLHYGDPKIDRFLSGEWKNHLQAMRAELVVLKKELPPQYPFLHAIHDVSKAKEQRVWIRGSRENLGDPAPPRFLSILSTGEPARFTKGSGRLELAEAIANPSNPLTARVIVNRVWQHHFGHGLVRTPSNFGKQGEPPTHPELLDSLSRRFMREGWSLKKLHREMMLSSTYALGEQTSAKNFEADPDNRLLWRANQKRLDAEALRDSLLFVTGKLDTREGGLAEAFTAENRRRTVYGFISRKKLDGILSLFDFPNPNNTSEQRMETNVPLQRLFFMNSEFVSEQSKALTGRLAQAGADAEKIMQAYRLLFQRAPTPDERKLGLEFLQQTNGAWPQYAQVLLSSNEFSFVR
ncbi:MAG: PSD1 and planctomycete cytochrome C domain-containing protein, partial [Acidobacteriota bacterium]|nr:PSD1 and planctomycete cytochrome C domain-containing protein [Acidobacteriota bacterium]